MADLHIDDFYKDVAKIFIRLYAVFPRKITLYIEDICGPDQPDEFGLHHPRFQACFSTVVWLAQHQYLLFDGVIRQEALDASVLSQKALLLLTARSDFVLPHTEEHHPSQHNGITACYNNIDLLRDALREESSTLLNGAVNYLLRHPATQMHQDAADSPNR